MDILLAQWVERIGAWIAGGHVWRPAVEVALFWTAYYVLLVFIKDSGMVQAIKGLFFLLAVFFLADVLGLRTIHWVLGHLFQISILGFLIIFQPELRRGLMRIGQSPLFKIFLKEQRLIDEIVKAVFLMSKKRIGALIAIEKEVGLKPYIESGIALDGVLTSELLLTVFMPNTPFHDGGAVVQGGRVVAVGCLFPLSQNQNISKMLGTRHRAALGLSEETDAFVIVVSEETGTVSVVHQTKMTRHLDEAGLKASLTELYQPQKARRRGRAREEAGAS